MRLGLEMISGGSGFGAAAGGLVPYYEGLLRALSDRPDVDGIVAFVSPWNAGLSIPDGLRVQTVVCKGLTRNRLGRVIYEQLALPVLARRASVDVMLFTCNVKPLLWRRPSAVVLQSIQHFLLPGRIGRARSIYLNWAVPRSLRSADHVIAVTKTERTDAIRLFDLDATRVGVVYHGMSTWARRIMEGEDPGPAYVLPDGRPFVLIVSRLYDFKNHRRLIEAFAHLVRDDQVAHSLVIVGGDADVTRAELKRWGEKMGLTDRLHCLGPVPQDDIPGLFIGADAIAYVSLYETFGHPVLEAFAFSKPLVTSSTGSTAEISGGAARLVDPYDVDSIQAGLREVLLDNDLRSRLSESGPRRAAEFSWERCAAGTRDALDRAVQRHQPFPSAPDRGTVHGARLESAVMEAPLSAGADVSPAKTSVVDWQEELFDEMVLRDPIGAFGNRPLQDILIEKRIKLAAARVASGDAVLELGCGNGLVTRGIAERTGADVTAVDVSGECIRYAQTHSKHPSVTYFQSSIEHFHPTKPFDLVTLYEVLEHVSDPEAIMRLIHSWLRPAGCFIISTPNRASLNRRIKNLPLMRDLYRRVTGRDAVAAIPSHFEEYRFDELCRMLKDTGFDILVEDGVILMMPFQDVLGALSRQEWFCRLNVASGRIAPRLALHAYVVAQRTT